MMEPTLYYKSTVLLNASPGKVWNALTNPDVTVQYMYGCIPVTDWQPGSELVWRGAGDGVDYVVGHVVSFIPEKELSFTVFDPNAKYEDIPENYLTSRYILTEEEGMTRLEVSQGDYAKVADGSKRYEHTGQGWEMALGKLKEVVES